MVALVLPSSGSGTPGAHSHAESDVTGLITDLGTLSSDVASRAAKTSNLSDLASAAAARSNLGAAPAAYKPSPAEQHGYLGEAFDLALAASTVTPASGTLYVARLYVPRACTVTNLVHVIATAGATLTAAQNLAALFDDAGNRLATTADQSTAWTTTGAKVAALSAPQAIADDTFVRVVLLSVGTTPPALRAGSGSLTINAGLSAAGLRFGTGATGQTSIPSTITPSGLSATGSFWVGLT